MKVMDKASLVSRNKLIQAQTEREILGLLDHPFLPTLYSQVETDTLYFLVMEYRSGGGLHNLQQKQPNKYFSEQAACLLVKDPQKRIAYRRGATEIRQHPLFEDVNWALVRSSTPPHIPEPVDLARFACKEVPNAGKKPAENGINGKDMSKGKTNDSPHLDFEYF
ncbi:hypothetical protein COCNU_06G005210 [Cocos nucifera]|uniref:non-specific serine/threonine protein kinase n=1 Tax=Cocos nucifera TaxID=13894 RepID=A0A8K0IB85_COCNU|nr:hypothetical protein COCNU_06G005210 [Cocos nucifera]